MRKLIIPFLTLAALSACVEDEGNYSYTPVNSVTIGGLEDPTSEDGKYTLLSKVDTLRITPEIEGSVYGTDESKYEYKWHLCLSGHSNHRVISTERNLEWFADVNPGTYNLYFTVTDKDTKIERNEYIQFTTVSALSKGFVILGKDENTDLLGMDMIAMPPNRDTIVVKDVFDNSELQLRNPVRVQYSGSGAMYSDAMFLWLYADDKAYSLDFRGNFEILAEFRDMGMFEPDIDGYNASEMKMLDLFPHMGKNCRSLYDRAGGYVTDKYVMFQTQTSNRNLFMKACNRYSATSNDYFKPFPYVMMNNNILTGSQINANNPPILYDMDADMFVKVYYNYGTSTNVQYFTDYPQDPFQFAAYREKRKLFYAQNTFDASGMSCVIMRGTEDDSWHIYRFKHRTSSWYPDTKEYYPIDLAIVTDFDKASHYMFSSNRTAIFYSVGNRLYQYDYARKVITYKDFDSEITLLEPEIESRGQIDAFMVATYDPIKKGTVYKMYHGYNANEVTFEDSPNEIWHTDLKVVSITYKQ